MPIYVQPDALLSACPAYIASCERVALDFDCPSRFGHMIWKLSTNGLVDGSPSDLALPVFGMR